MHSVGEEEEAGSRARYPVHGRFQLARFACVFVNDDVKNRHEFGPFVFLLSVQTRPGVRLSHRSRFLFFFKHPREDASLWRRVKLMLLLMQMLMLMLRE